MSLTLVAAMGILLGLACLMMGFFMGASEDLERSSEDILPRGKSFRRNKKHGINTLHHRRKAA